MSKKGQVGLWIVEIKKCITWKSIAVVLDCLSLHSEVFFFFFFFPLWFEYISAHKKMGVYV
jgi:hypothetical protein